MRPPFVPLCGGDPADTRNFDSEFTKLNVNDTAASVHEPDSLLDYEGFSFLDEEYRAQRERDMSSSELHHSTDRHSSGSSGLLNLNLGQPNHSDLVPLYDEEMAGDDDDVPIDF